MEIRKAVRRIIASFEKDLSVQIEGWLAYLPERGTYFVCARGKGCSSFLYVVDVLAGKVMRKQILGAGSRSIH